MVIQLKEYANIMLENIKESFEKKKATCTLVIVTVGNDDASLVYVNNKIKKCEQIKNVECKWVQLDETTTQEALNQELCALSLDKNIHGILLQQPLPTHLDPEAALMQIDPKKDVDGLTLANKEKLYTSRTQDSVTPCTAIGVLLLLEYYFKDGIHGKTVLIIGRSDLAGRPLAHAIEECDGTLLWANSHTPTETLKSLVYLSDVIITATGVKNLIHSSYINLNKRQFFIDIGINRDEANRLAGDCSLNDVATLDLCDVTAVPGGIGQLTTTMVLFNLYKCWNMQRK